MSEMFPIGNGLNRDALLPLLYSLAFEYAIRRVQVNQDGLKLNGAHQLWFMLMMLIYWEEMYILQSRWLEIKWCTSALVYADEVNILGGNVYTTKQNAQALVVC